MRLETADERREDPRIGFQVDHLGRARFQQMLQQLRAAQRDQLGFIVEQWPALRVTGITEHIRQPQEFCCAAFTRLILVCIEHQNGELDLRVIASERVGEHARKGEAMMRHHRSRADRFASARQ